jgi:hypothetical protein
MTTQESDMFKHKSYKNDKNRLPFDSAGLTRRTLGGLGLVMALVGLSACQSLPSEPVPQERGELLQRMDAVMQGAQSRSGLGLQIQPNPVTTGQTIGVEVSSAQAGYLYLYQIATDGKTLSMVFPNAVDGANYIQPGTTQLPRASWQLRAKGPEGLGYLMAVLTQQPLNLLTVQGQANLGQFSTQAPYAAASSTLREIAQR